MAGQLASTLKSYFQRFSKPTAAQFAELIDSIYSPVEDIVPGADGIDIGVDDNKFRDLHLSGSVHSETVETNVINNAGETNSQVNTNIGLHTIAMGGKFNFGNGNIQTITLSGNMALTFENLKIGVYKLIVKQDSTGGRLLTFSNALKSGAFQTVANNIDVVDIVCDGATVYCGITNNFRA